MLPIPGMQVIHEVLAEEELDSTLQNTSSLARGVSSNDDDVTLVPQQTQVLHPLITINVPSTAPPTSSQSIAPQADSVVGSISLTTPIKHSHKSETPLHSTPRPKQSMKGLNVY